MAEGKTTVKDILDKLVLVLVLVLLLASSVYLLVMIRVERGKLKDGEVGLQPSSPKAAVPIDLAAYRASIEGMVSAALDGGTTNRFPMTSEARVTCINPQCQRPIPYHAEECPFCGMKQPPPDKSGDDRDGDGIPNIYEKDHDMDPYDPRDALMDPDGDGFTNREEYESKTDPNDPESRPPIGAKLRIAGTKQDLIDLTFWGTQQFSADELRFQLNSRRRGRSYFVVIGDEIEGYTVDRFLPDPETGVETLILKKDGKEYGLVKDEPFTFGDWMANLVSLMTGRRYNRVKQDTEITIEDAQYIVVDISKESAIIRDKDTGEDLSVGRISPAEAAQLNARMSGGTLRRR